VTQGLRNKEVAASLGISEGTVQVHVKSIFGKLGVNDRTAAVTIALRRGIVHIS
jgi:DNA-binding NarL/FixJ family response regulator